MRAPPSNSRTMASPAHERGIRSRARRLSERKFTIRANASSPSCSGSQRVALPRPEIGWCLPARPYLLTGRRQGVAFRPRPRVHECPRSAYLPVNPRWNASCTGRPSDEPPSHRSHCNWRIGMTTCALRNGPLETGRIDHVVAVGDEHVAASVLRRSAGNAMTHRPGNDDWIFEPIRSRWAVRGRGSLRKIRALRDENGSVATTVADTRKRKTS